VTSQHNPRALVIAYVLADEGTHLVLLDGGHILKVLAHYGTHLVLVTRDASYFCDILQKSLGLIHDLLLVMAAGSRFGCGWPMIPQLGLFV
jgi:hypothetical protein